MSEATKRPWKIVEHNWVCTSIYCGDRRICSLSIDADEELPEDASKALEAQQARDASLIVRAVNTFDQAREALKRAQRALLLCEKCIPEKHYMNHGCYTQEHARMSIQEIGDVLTTMEAAYE